MLFWRRCLGEGRDKGGAAWLASFRAVFPVFQIVVKECMCLVSRRSTCSSCGVELVGSAFITLVCARSPNITH